MVPAAGAINAAVRVAERMADLTAATWVDVGQDPVSGSDAA